MPALDHRSLALADTQNIKSLINNYIDRRLEDIRYTEKYISIHPEAVFYLDGLMKKTKEDMAISPGLMEDDIVDKYAAEVKLKDALPGVTLSVFSIALSVLTMGIGGMMSGIGVLGSMGVGAYDIIRAYDHYELQSASYGSSLSSEEPSKAWVIVSLVGIGFGAAAIRKTIKSISPLLEAFWHRRINVEQLKCGIRAIRDISKKAADTIIETLEKELEIDNIFHELTSGPSIIQSLDDRKSIGFRKLVYALHAYGERGISPNRIITSAEGHSLFGPLSHLSRKDIEKFNRVCQIAEDFLEKITQKLRKSGLANRQIGKALEIYAYKGEEDIENIARNLPSYGINDIEDLMESLVYDDWFGTIYSCYKQNIKEFHIFVKDRKVIDKFGDISKLSRESIKEIGNYYKMIINNIQAAENSLKGKNLRPEEISRRIEDMILDGKLKMLSTSDIERINMKRSLIASNSAKEQNFNYGYVEGDRFLPEANLNNSIKGIKNIPMEKVEEVWQCFAKALQNKALPNETVENFARKFIIFNKKGNTSYDIRFDDLLSEFRFAINYSERLPGNTYLVPGIKGMPTHGSEGKDIDLMIKSMAGTEYLELTTGKPIMINITNNAFSGRTIKYLGDGIMHTVYKVSLPNAVPILQHEILTAGIKVELTKPWQKAEAIGMIADALNRDQIRGSRFIDKLNLFTDDGDFMIFRKLGGIWSASAH